MSEFSVPKITACTGRQKFFWVCSSVYYRLLSTTTVLVRFAFRKSFSNIWGDKLEMLLIRHNDGPHLTYEAIADGTNVGDALIDLLGD